MSIPDRIDESECCGATIPENGKIHTLIFDSSSGGHHGEFLENLICGIPNESSTAYLILAHPKLEPRLHNAKQLTGSSIKITFLKPSELELIESAKGIVEIGRRQLNILGSYVNLHQPDRVLLMHMNLHQYALHNWKTDRQISIAGIMLSPFTPFSRAYDIRAKAYCWVTGIRKLFQFRLMLRNKAISRIYLLNDKRMADYLNRWNSRRAVFESVVDPIPALWPKVAPIPSTPEIRKQRFTFLLAGSMSPRKGVLEVLKALQLIEGDLRSKISLRIVGKFASESNYRQEVVNLAEIIKQESGSATVTMVEGFISNEVLSQEFANCDCVLIPYIQFYGSSGMIGHACRYRKPILSCREGLVGELVESLEIGIAADPRDLFCFGQAMKQIVLGNYDINNETASDYEKEANYVNFCKIVNRHW